MFFSDPPASACYGYGSLPSDYSFAAAAPSIYSNGAACGRYYCVKCTSNGCRNSNVIRVKIVDLCPGCPGAFDLSQQAFARIANPDPGTFFALVDFSHGLPILDAPVDSG
ncbi:EG45-like domain containing protein [Selaginella moellendorffii]|uniref:EG45-like domain containing protein n=1 Tax=Selaginella moellendorffii TaxID=88036 RepID=UPI000D1CC30E|nr:EG45-like domain containing protein [Selaginella moellendorffii]|eukprot:XP_002979846.2 EG45-like domain containing protein [Selaginella moellendorffii]